MTEIPEHLLKRSKAAKSGSSGGDSGSDADETPATSNAPVAASADPATAVEAADNAPLVTFPNLDPEPEPEKPEPHYVTASKKRNRIPVWALPVVAAVPVWAISFAGTMQQPETEDPVFVESAAIYTEAGCSGCHGATGGGGSGYQLSDGEVLTTFPGVIDQMVHVARGSAAIQGETYGEAGRRVSGDLGQMPAQIGTLTRHELELVVFHERATLSGEDVDQPGFAEWIEHMREEAETGGGAEIVDQEYVDFLLACADPAVTPGATGAGSPDPEDQPCPGPKSEAAE